MTTKLIRRENRLLKLLGRSGGVLAKEVIDQAKTNLEGIREQTAAEVDRAFEKLREAARRTAADPSDEAARRALYAHANVIAGIAACGGLAHVGAAAYQLCELVDRYEVQGVWKPKAIQVCLEAMALLRSPERAQDDHAAGCILGGLAELTRHAVTPTQS